MGGGGGRCRAWEGEEFLKKPQSSGELQLALRGVAGRFLVVQGLTNFSVCLGAEIQSSLSNDSTVFVMLRVSVDFHLSLGGGGGGGGGNGPGETKNKNSDGTLLLLLLHRRDRWMNRSSGGGGGGGRGRRGEGERSVE